VVARLPSDWILLASMAARQAQERLEAGGWECNPRHVLPYYLYSCVLCGLGHSPTTPVHIFAVFTSFDY
jgi:hypothetical protein